MPKPNPTKTNIKEKKTAKKESKCKLTEIVFILDKSGSMFGKEKDTIGGFNSFIEKQKQEVMYLHCLLRPTWLRS